MSPDPLEARAQEAMALDWTLADDPDRFAVTVKGWPDAENATADELDTLFDVTRRAVINDTGMIRERMAARALSFAAKADKLTDFKTASAELRINTQYDQDPDMATGTVKESFDKEQQGWLEPLSEPDAEPTEMETALAAMAGMGITTGPTS